MGFRLRLIVSLILIEVAIGGTLYYLHHQALTASAHQSVQHQHENHALFIESLLKSHSKMGILNHQSSDLQFALTRLTQGENDLAYIRVRSSSSEFSPAVSLESRASYFNSDFQQDTGVNLEKNYYCSSRQFLMGSQIYWLDLAINLRPTAKALKINKQQYIYATLGLLCLVALTGVALFRNYGRGILSLNNAVRAIENGQLGYTISDPGHLAELRPTAEAFNHMSERLSLTVNEQEKLYKDLLKKDRRLELVLNSTDEAIIGLNASREICIVNISALKLFEVDLASEINIDHMLPVEARDGLDTLYLQQTPFHLDDVCILSALERFIPAEIRGSQIGLQEETFTILSFRNLSIEKRIQKEVEQQNSLKAALMDASLDGILLMDTRGNTLSYNISMFNLYRRLHPGGKDVDVLKLLGIEKTGIGSAIDMLEECFRINTGIHTLIAEDPNGDTIHLEYNIQAFDAKGQLYYTLVTTDITDKVKSREELERAMEEADAANIAKSQFLAAMSHEIRTPLNGIHGSISLLENTILNAHQQELLRTATVSSNALMQVINDVLDFSRIEAGKMELENSVVSLTRLIRETEIIIGPKAQEKQLTVETRVDPAITHCVMVDAGRLRQICLNLLSNAIKFTEAGRIRIKIDRLKTSPDQMQIRIRVEDDGIGIETDKQAQLFSEFTQANQSDSRKFGGSGLGLAISQKLAELMNGFIIFSSERGVGSTFAVYLTLPVTQTPADLPEPEVAHPVQQHLVGRYRILLVEDSITNQLIATQMLDSLGQQAEVANNGLEAVEAIRQRPFDLILMDLQMPEMDGYEATEAIRQLPRGHSIPIIAMTANVMTSSKEQCFAIGMNDFLSKPAQLSELQSTLVHWLEGDGIDKEKEREKEKDDTMTTQTANIDAQAAQADQPATPERTQQPENPHSEPVSVEDKPGMNAGAGQVVIGSNCQASENSPSDQNDDDNSEIFSLPVIHQMESDIGADRCQQMIGIVLDEIINRHQQLQQHAVDNDFDMTGKQAHALKSTSASFGLMRVSHYARTIEQKCRAGEGASIQDDVQKLNQAITDGTAALQAYRHSAENV